MGHRCINNNITTNKIVNVGLRPVTQRLIDLLNNRSLQ